MQYSAMVELGIALTRKGWRATFWSMNDLSPKRQDKYRAYRARKKAAGLREIRMWVPDMRTREFWEQSVREAEALRNCPGEEETMRWIEALYDEQPGMWD